MENIVLDSLTDLGYTGPLIDEAAFAKALEGGAKSLEFTMLIHILAKELKKLYNLEETVNVINDPDESSSFLLELSSFLKGLGCPYKKLVTGHMSSRLQTKEDCILLLDYMISELMAARMVNVDCPKEKAGGAMEIVMQESPTAKDLKEILISLKFNKPPPNITPEMLFTKLEAKLKATIQKEGQQLVGKPLYNKALSDKEWKHLETCFTDMFEEYWLRRETLITRHSFEWPDRLKTKKDQIQSCYRPKRSQLKVKPDVRLSDFLAARTSLLQVEKTSSASVRKNTQTKVNKVIVGHVPDRGGRPNEGQPPPPEMQRSPPQGGSRGGRGGVRGFGGGDRGGRSGGRGGRVQGEYNQQAEQRLQTSPASFNNQNQRNYQTYEVPPGGYNQGYNQYQGYNQNQDGYQDDYNSMGGHNQDECQSPQDIENEKQSEREKRERQKRRLEEIKTLAKRPRLSSLQEKPAETDILYERRAPTFCESKAINVSTYSNDYPMTVDSIYSEPTAKRLRPSSLSSQERIAKTYRQAASSGAPAPAASTDAPTAAATNAPQSTSGPRPGSVAIASDWQLVANKKRNVPPPSPLQAAPKAPQKPLSKRAKARAANRERRLAAKESRRLKAQGVQPPKPSNSDVAPTERIQPGLEGRPVPTPHQEGGDLPAVSAGAPLAATSSAGEAPAAGTAKLPRSAMPRPRGQRAGRGRGKAARPANSGHVSDQAKLDNTLRLDGTISPRGDRKRASIVPQPAGPRDSVSYADSLATKELCVAIMTEPYVDLKPGEADLIKAELETRLDQEEDAMGRTPAFRGRPHLGDGVVKLWCDDDYALEWLRRVVPTISSPRAGTRLVVKRLSEVPKRVKCGLFVPGWTGDLNSLRRKLTSQNISWCDVRTWSLYHAEQQGNPPGQFLVLGVPQTDVPKIMARQRRIAYRLGSVYIRFFRESRGEGLSNEPPPPTPAAGSRMVGEPRPQSSGAPAARAGGAPAGRHSPTLGASAGDASPMPRRPTS